MNTKLGKMLLAVGLVAALSPSTGIAQTDYPNRSISIVVPYGPGGTTDLVGRALADNLSRQLGQPVVVENKPGAAGAMGVLSMLGAKPDGYRLTMAPVGIFRQPYVQKTRYDPIRDLTYIASFLTYDFAVTVKDDSPFRSIKDLVDYARQNPGAIDYGTPGLYTGNQVVMAMLGKRTDTRFTHVPFKGDADALTALIGGHVKAAVVTNSVLPYLKSGTVRVLATADKERNPAFGGVPTLLESGYDVVVPSPLGLAGPADLPQPIVEKLDNSVKQALEDPQVKQVFENIGVREYYMDHKTYADFARNNFAAEKDIVTNLDLRN